MKILITGAKGQLGHDIINRLKILKEKNSKKIEFKGIDISDLDLTDQKALNAYMNKYRPDTVIHCAAWTAVDKAEDEKDKCQAVNVNATGYLARACRKIDAKMVYISTDYVFSGLGETPFQIDSEPSPVNWYGQTKYDGELEVKKALDNYFIIRISWVFGINGDNFVNKMISLAKSRDSLSVINDQIGSPTYTYDLAELICTMIDTDKYGTYHATNEGFCSWYDFANEIFKQTNIRIDVKPVASEEFKTRAKRPKNSRLDKECLELNGFHKMRPWQKALGHYLELMKSFPLKG